MAAKTLTRGARRHVRHLRSLIRAAEQAGWSVYFAGNDHVCFEPPAGRRYFASATPRGPGSERALRSVLRRHGVEV